MVAYSYAFDVKFELYCWLISTTFRIGLFRELKIFRDIIRFLYTYLYRFQVIDDDVGSLLFLIVYLWLFQLEGCLF